MKKNICVQQTTYLTDQDVFTELLMVTAEALDQLTMVLLRRLNEVNNVIVTFNPTSEIEKCKQENQLPPDEPLMKGSSGAIALLFDAILETLDAANTREIALFDPHDNSNFNEFKEKIDRVKANYDLLGKKLKSLEKSHIQ